MRTFNLIEERLTMTFPRVASNTKWVEQVNVKDTAEQRNMQVNA